MILEVCILLLLLLNCMNGLMYMHHVCSSDSRQPRLSTTLCHGAYSTHCPAVSLGCRSFDTKNSHISVCGPRESQEEQYYLIQELVSQWGKRGCMAGFRVRLGLEKATGRGQGRGGEGRGVQLIVKAVCAALSPLPVMDPLYAQQCNTVVFIVWVGQSLVLAHLH